MVSETQGHESARIAVNILWNGNLVRFLGKGPVNQGMALVPPKTPPLGYPKE
jgi:hypothetical protein